MKKILFVCLGNICRSPLAEGIARNIAREKLFLCEVDPAGTSGFHVGEPPCEDSIRIAKMHDINISKLRARQVTRNDIGRFDYVVAMDAENRKNLEKMGFENVYLLGDFAGYEGKDVPDPYFFESFDDGIKNVYTMISSCVEDFIQKAADETL